MSIQFTCKECRTQNRVTLKRFGSMVKCRNCGAAQSISQNQAQSNEATQPSSNVFVAKKKPVVPQESFPVLVEPVSLKPRKKSALSTLISLAVCVILAGTIWLIIDQASSSPAVDVPRVVKRVLPAAVADPELVLVRNYLRENTDTGEWEEVKWWPARMLVKEHEQRTKPFRDSIRKAERLTGLKVVHADEVNAIDNEKFRNLSSDAHDIYVYACYDKKTLEELNQAGPDTVCRLKYRTKNKIGAMVLFDTRFFIRNGKVIPFDRDDHVTYRDFDLFPDEDGIGM